MRQLDDADIALVLDFIDRQWVDWDSVPSAEDVAALRARVADEPLLEGREALERLLEEVAP